MIFIGHEKQIGRGAEPEAIEAHGDGGGERNAFDEDFAGVEFSVAVSIFEDDDTTVTLVGKACLARFIVAIFGDPHPSAIVPAKRHGLCDQRFAGSEFRLEASRDGHLGRGLFAGEKDGLLALGFGEAPEDGIVGLSSVGLP